MMTKQRLPLLTLATLLFSVIVPAARAASPAPAPSPTKVQRAGSITALLPIAHIDRGVGKNKVTTDAKKGDEVIWNDLIRTDRGGRARITLADQSILSLGSQADLRIVKHDARNQQTALEMTYGRVRAEVARVTRQGGSFELRTPTAVAGVIGTDFGVESSMAGGSMFVCISGLVQISNVDPNIAGSVQCAPGMTTTVTPGKAPTPPANASPEQIQQLIQDTEPAIIAAMSPVTALPGTTVDATLTGTKMGSIKSASADGSGVTASLVGVTDTSATVHIVIAQNAAPGPRTIHLGKQSGADSAAVFTVLSPPTAVAAGQDQKKGYLDLMGQEGQTTIGGLSAYLAAAQQAANLALQQLQQSNSTNLNLNDATSQFNAQVSAVQDAINNATKQINDAVAQANSAFGGQYDTALQALQQRNPAGGADDQFNTAVKTAFDTTNGALAKAFNDIRSNLQGTVDNAGQGISQATQTWMTTITQASARPCDPGQICPKVNSIERNVDVGAALGGAGVQALDASSSNASTGGSIVSYRWMLCDPSYKPANVGQAMAGNNVPTCNAVPGYQSSSSDFQFPTCNLAPNDYVARVTVTDSNNRSAALDVRLHILAGAYDDPPTVVRDLAQAYSTLQLTTFLNYFDQTGFSGFTQLSENYRNTLTDLASMSINPRVSQAQISCNDATVRADWVQNYTYKKAPSITFAQSEQLSMRMVRTPGKGWLIVDFQGDNGTVQGAGQLPGPVVTDSPKPDLQVTDVFAGTTSGQTTIAPGGSQVFTAVVKNIGSADFTASTTVHFQLVDATNNPIAGAAADATLPTPVGAGSQVSVQATVSVPNLAPNTVLNIQATANPGNSAAEMSYSNNTDTTALTVGGGDLQVTSAYLTSLGSPATSAIPVAAGAYPFTAVIKNAGTSAFVGATVVRFSVSSTLAVPVDVPLGVTALAPGATATVQGTLLVPNVPGTQLTMTANVNPGCTAAETNCASDPANSFTQTLAVNALVTQSTSTTIQAGSPTGAALTIGTFGPAKLTLALPAGVTTDKALSQTLTAAGTFTWNLTADFTAVNAAAMTVVADNGVPVTLPVKYSILAPAFTQTATPGLLANGPAGTLSVSVNVPGSFTLALPSGITTSSANPQTITTATGGTLTWNLASDFTAATGTALTANITAGQYTFSAKYNNVGPTFTQTATPSLIANGPAQALTVTVNTGGTFTLTLPVGVTTTSTNPQTLTSAGGTLTWNIQSDLTAATGTAVPATITSGPVTFNAQFANSGPTFTQTATPTLLSAGSAQALTVTVNTAGTFTLVLPAGVTTTSANPQTITANTGGTLSWNVQADFTAATGAQTINITSGPVTFAAAYTVNGQANYIITSAVFSGHTAPYTGANALQVGESGTNLIVVVQNAGDASPVGNVTLTATCAPLNTADTTSCQGGGNPTATVAAPAAGQSVTATLPLGSNNGMIPGKFNGTATLTTAITQSSTSDDTFTIPFDVADFVLTVQNQISPQYILPGSSQNFTVAVQVMGTTPFPVPVTLSFASTALPGVTFSPSSASVGGTQTFSVTAASTTPTGGLAIMATGSNRGASRPTAQAFVIVSPQLVPTQIFVNDSSNPLLIPVGSTTAQTVPFEITGSAFSGAATIVLPTVTGFAINTDATAGAVYSSPFNVSLTANSASTAAVPMTITAQLPNTSPVLSIARTLYIQGSGQPDLAVTSAAPNVTLSSSTPWIDGQGVDFSVQVQNVGNAPTAGGEKVDVELNGVPVGTGNLSITPMAAGGTQTITIHAVAPDVHGNTAFGPSTVSGRVHVHPEQAGEPNYTNNSLAISPTMANWHIAANGAGSEANPVALTTGTTGGSATAYFVGTVDGGSLASYSSLNFVEGAGIASATFSVSNFSASCGANAPANTMFCATISTASTSLQPGVYFAQALVTLTDATSGQHTVRQATVAVQVNTGSSSAVPCLASSANNITSQNTACGSSSATTLEINGGLPVQFSVTPSLICGLPTAAVSCAGQVDLAVQDAANTTTTTTTTSGIPTGQQVVLHVGAVLDANGNVIAGQMPYVIGINGIQQALAAKRGSAQSPDPIGAKVNLAVQVGDLSVSATNVASANGAYCGGVVPGGSGLAVGIFFSPFAGFNAGYSWQWEDTNHSPVGGGVFSFSNSGGSGSPSSASTTISTGSPVNGLVRYFLAVTVTDPNSPTSTATKYYPFFFDGSTAQNYCGAISGARGRSTIQGTWSRSAADSLGPISGIAVSAANQKAATSATAGAADVHLVASDISFTPSIPKPGDTLLVRFRARNDGSADAVHVPIGLQVNGTVVAIDTFDITAGHSSLGGLSWTLPAGDAQTAVADGVRTAARGRMVEADAPVARTRFAGLTQMQAVLVVDPNHTTPQATTADKTATIARLNVRTVAGDAAAAAAAPGQRVLIELEDGACAGLRLTSGGMMPCGSADLELTVADLAKSQLGLDTMAGVSDVGSTFEASAARTANYSEQVAGLSGHAYSVRLPNGGTATVTIESVRNPAELDAKTRAVFRASAVRIMRSLGDSSGPSAAGDLTGNGTHASVFITLNVKQN